MKIVYEVKGRQFVAGVAKDGSLSFIGAGWKDEYCARLVFYLKLTHLDYETFRITHRNGKPWPKTLDQVLSENPKHAIRVYSDEKFSLFFE